MTVSDEELYLIATNEAESSDRRPALWAKAMTLADGNEEKAKYRYVQLRVEAMLASEQMVQLGSEETSFSADNSSLPRHDVTSMPRLKAYDDFDIDEPERISNIEVRANKARSENSRFDVAPKYTTKAPSAIREHTVWRQILGTLTLICGLGLLFLALWSFSIFQGEKLGFVLLAVGFFALLSWPLIVGGYKEVSKTGFAGLGTAFVGFLTWAGQIYALHQFLEKHNLRYSDLPSVPAFFEVFGPGLFAFLLGVAITYLGWSGSARNK